MLGLLFFYFLLVIPDFDMMPTVRPHTRTPFPAVMMMTVADR